ncbi:MAG: VOC family protein [Gemmatimonadaceae bacterium]
MHGQFIWYELTTPDVAAAKKFYPRFTGWGTQPFDNDYTMWTTGGAPFAGLFHLKDEMRQQGIPPNWMAYVESSNVDDTIKKATSLGGAVMFGPQDIPNVGRFVVLADPQGAVFGVYKSANDLRAWDGTPVVGRFSWHELMTTDYQKAFEFYSALFGWEKTGEMDMGGGNMYFMFGKGDKATAACSIAPPRWPTCARSGCSTSTSRTWARPLQLQRRVGEPSCARGWTSPAARSRSLVIRRGPASRCTT